MNLTSKGMSAMKHIVYKTTNIVNDKYYIGVHTCYEDSSCKNKNGECFYLGSGDVLKKAIKKYGRDSFKRIILKRFKTREEALKYEKEIVITSSEDELSYNVNKGGVTIVNEDRVRGSNNPCYNKRVSRSQREKMSNSKKGMKRAKSTIEKTYKPCIVHNVFFKSLSEAAKTTNITIQSISYRLNSENFPDCYYFHKELHSNIKFDEEIKNLKTPQKTTKKGRLSRMRKCSVNGVEYESVTAARLDLGLTRGIEHRFESKTEKFKNYIYLECSTTSESRKVPKHKKTKPRKRKLTCDGIKYESITHAALTLGMSRGGIKHRIESESPTFSSYRFLD